MIPQDLAPIYLQFNAPETFCWRGFSGFSRGPAQKHLPIGALPDVLGCGIISILLNSFKRTSAGAANNKTF